MASVVEGTLSVSLATVVEDVLKQHWTRVSDIDLASRKAEEAVTRRYEAAGWLRKVVGVVLARDLPDEPSEEEFRLGLRNGLILCNALNKVHPGAVPKVVFNPGDSVVSPDGAALSAYQYFENIRNFLVAVEELGLPSFDASDLEKGGKSARIVNCVLALKSYCEWKLMGGHGSWKYGGNLKPSSSVKSFLRLYSDIRRSPSMSESEFSCIEHNLQGDLSTKLTEMNKSHSLDMLLRAVLSDKRPEEVPQFVESLLQKVLAEYENRITKQSEQVKTTSKDSGKDVNKSNLSVGFPCLYKEVDAENLTCSNSKKEDYIRKNFKEEEHLKEKILEQTMIFKQQQRNIEELKRTLQTTKSSMKFIQNEYVEKFNMLGTHLHGLACAASNYHKVLEENRKLYNQVQDLKGSIRVYCRVRPFLPGQISGSTIGGIDEGNIKIITPLKYGKEGHRSFNFNKVFGPSASQDEVFSDTQPLIRSVLDGYNVCIFAYGQTGSGKTYTMSGPKDLNEKTQGVNFRALNDLFKLSEQRRGAFSYEIAVQMIEIYNEQVRDLLISDGLNKKLEIRNSSQKGLAVPNANLVPVMSTSDVIELMNIGQKNRAVGATALNDRSSRSHSCLTVHVQGRDMNSGTVLRGCMHLVDLAGSERVDKSEVTGERLKEAQHINKSLSALGDVIAALAQKNSHVPYRNSKLTQLLQDSLGGQAKTLMFVHISPEMDATGETLSTLKFAERVATVELGAARVNKEGGEIKELREQLASLKATLARKEEGQKNPENMISNYNSANSKTPSPLHSSKNGYLSNQTSHRQPMEDVGNIEVSGHPPLRQKKPSFDLNDLLTANDSPSWPDRNKTANVQIKDAKEILSDDWVNKIMVNKNEAVVRDEVSIRDWEGDSTTLPDFFYKRYLSDTPDQQFGSNTTREESQEFAMQRSQFYSAATDDSDDLDITTSDSSEADLQWRFNVQNVQSTVNESGSRIRKPQAKPTKSPNIRTPQYSHIPSPFKKVSSGSNRVGRQPNLSASAGKRNTSSVRMSHVK